MKNDKIIDIVNELSNNKALILKLEDVINNNQADKYNNLPTFERNLLIKAVYDQKEKLQLNDTKILSELDKLLNNSSVNG